METYNSLLKDDDFLSDAAYALEGMGYKVSNNRKDTLDKFLQTRRYFETNLASTITQGDNIKDLKNIDKKSLRNALDKIDQLPSIFDKGSAPKWTAVKDYALAGLSDPTNLLSVIAGAFTLGSGTAVGFGAKEAVKQGIKSTLKSKANALLTKEGLKKTLPTIKALGVEGTVSGAGALEQARRSQEVDMEIGRREKGDYDVGQILTQGIIEGVASPLAGAGLNIGSTLTKESVKGLGKVVGVNDSQFIKNTQHFLEKWFAPAAGLDKASLREIEEAQAAFQTIRQKAEDVAEDIDSAFKRDFIADNQADIDIINKAMEGERKALEEIRVKSVDMAKALQNFNSLRKEVYTKIGKEKLDINENLASLYKRTPKYTRDIFEKFTNISRPPVEEYLQKNINAIDDFEKLILSDNQIEVAKALGLRDEAGEFTDVSLDTKQKILLEEFKNLYNPDTRGKSKYGSLKSKNKDLPDVIKSIYGLNLNPALRATQTIQGIVEPIADLRIASGLKAGLQRRNIGIQASSGPDAAAKLGTNEEMVPLISNKSNINKKQLKETPFQIRGDIYDNELERFYVPKTVADKIKVMVDRTGYLSKNEFLGPLAQAFAASQGYMKKGKTVYSPFAHIRNFLGAMLNVANSGNWGGIGKYTQEIRKLPKKEKEEFFRKMNDLGISGTNVELNQILNRLTDLGDISEDNLKGLSGWAARNLVRGTSLGVSELEKGKFGRKVSRRLERLYTKTDDLGKMMAFLGERAKAKKMFTEMTPEQKREFRVRYRNTLARDPDSPTEKEIDQMLRVSDIGISKEFIDGQKQRIFRPKKVSKIKSRYEKLAEEFDNKMLDEFATQKALDVMPVYSRIPRILEKMRGIPVIGSFTAFPAENLRNKYNVLRLGAQEIRDGFELGNNSLIKTGANRLLSQGAIASAPIIAAYTYNEVNGTDKVMSFIRESFPEWSKYHALQVRKRKNKKGEDEYAVTDLSYNNPDQFVLDIISPLMVSAANGEDVSKSLDTLFKDVIIGVSEPFVDKSLILQYAEETMGFIRADNPEISARKLVNMYKISEPGLLKNLREISGDLGAYQAIDKFSKVMGGEGAAGSFLQSKLDPLYFGDKRRELPEFNNVSEVARYLSEVGLVGDNYIIPFTPASKETILNPKKQLGFAVKTLMGNANSDFNITSSTIKKRLQDTQSNFTLKGMLDLYKDSIEEQFAAQQGVYTLVKSLLEFTSKDDVKKMLKSKEIKQAGGLSNKEINKIIEGEFVPPTFDRSFFKLLRKNYPEIANRVPYINTKFIELNNIYKDRDLLKELPDIVIGD